jgi:hypothetical protein
MKRRPSCSVNFFFLSERWGPIVAVVVKYGLRVYTWLIIDGHAEGNPSSHHATSLVGRVCVVLSSRESYAMPRGDSEQ